MKKIIMGGVVALVSTTVFAASLSSSQDKLSYAMGYETGKAFQQHKAPVQYDAYVAGLQDALKNKKPALTEQQMQQILAQFQQQSLKKIQAQMKQQAAANAAQSAKFMADNKSKPGVKTTASGLQYKIVDAGKGDQPTSKSTVVVDYEGSLADGKVFDSSYKRGQPASFPVSGVIPGFSEGLQMMRPGATWIFYIPPKLAYGKMGVPGAIPPESALIFKVHLREVK